MPQLVTTLCFVHRGDEILLGYKKRGFGKGTWNGFGGKVEVGESIADAAMRELFEESCVRAKELQKRAILTFAFQDGTPSIEMHVFEVREFSGEPKETDEMRPVWYHTSRLPYEKMWVDDVHWVPLYLEGRCLRGHFHLQDQYTITHHEICEASPEELLHSYAG